MAGGRKYRTFASEVPDLRQYHCLADGCTWLEILGKSSDSSVLQVTDRIISMLILAWPTHLMRHISRLSAAVNTRPTEKDKLIWE